MADAVFDYIVVGAGAAGCVVAARLSADPAKRVLLLEAGADILPGQEPAAIRDPFPAGYGDPRYGWPNLLAAVGPERGNGRGAFTRPYVQGRVLGGGSSIMGMAAQRGLPDDFDEWQRLGADGWGWDGVLPYFNKLENDLDFSGPLHGNAGPLPIRRIARDAWPVFPRAVVEAMQARGYQYGADSHASAADGVYPMPISNLPERRVSTASAYLDAAARARPNLTVACDSVARQLLFDGRRVSGVEVRAGGPGGRLVRYDGREVIVCGGAIFSPALLLRSGIGPAAALRALGIAPLVDLAGVGGNLQNHPAIHVAVHLPRHAVQPAALRVWQNAMLRYSSGHADCPPGDMYMFPTSKTSWHPLGHRIGAISVCVHKPYSSGAVTLRSADLDAMPAVAFNLLADPRDFARMADGLRLVLTLLSSAAVRPHVNEIFHPSGGQANRLNRPGRGNWLQSWLISGLFDVAPRWRRMLLGRSVIDPAALLADDAALRQTVRDVAAGVHHVSGSCRIGSASDPGAVLDARCRVHGVAGLRVADASVMPTIVRATTHLTAVMIGEKVADMVRIDAATAPTAMTTAAAPATTAAAHSG